MLCLNRLGPLRAPLPVSGLRGRPGTHPGQDQDEGHPLRQHRGPAQASPRSPSSGASRCSKLSRELNPRLLFVCVWPTKDRPFYYKWQCLPLMAGSTTVRGLRSWDHPVSDGSQGTSFQHPGQLLTHSEPSRRIRVRNDILGTTLVVQKLGTPNCIVWGHMFDSWSEN